MFMNNECHNNYDIDDKIVLEIFMILKTSLQ